MGDSNLLRHWNATAQKQIITGLVEGLTSTINEDAPQDKETGKNELWKMALNNLSLRDCSEHAIMVL